MAKPKYTVYTFQDEPIAGDDHLDGHLKAIAANHDGYIIDRDGEVVYDARPAIQIVGYIDPADVAPTDTIDTDTEENDQ